MGGGCHREHPCARKGNDRAATSPLSASPRPSTNSLDMATRRRGCVPRTVYGTFLDPPLHNVQWETPSGQFTPSIFVRESLTALAFNSNRSTTTNTRPAPFVLLGPLILSTHPSLDISISSRSLIAPPDSRHHGHGPEPHPRPHRFGRRIQRMLRPVGPYLAFGSHLIDRVPCTERVLSSGTTTIPPGIRTHGTPGKRTVTIAIPTGAATHELSQASRRLGLLPGHLPYGRGDVHVMGICGTELRKARDLCSSTLVSLLNPHRVSPGPIKSPPPGHTQQLPSSVRNFALTP